MNTFIECHPYKITKITPKYIYTEGEDKEKKVFSRTFYTQKDNQLAYIVTIVPPEEKDECLDYFNGEKFKNGYSSMFKK